MSVSTQYAIAVVIIYLLLLSTAALAVMSVAVVTVIGWSLMTKLHRAKHQLGRRVAGPRASGPANRQYRPASTGTG